MPNANTVELVFQLLKQGDGASQAAADIKKVSEAAKEGTSALEGMKEGFEKILVGLGVEELLRKSVDAFLEFDQAMAKLNGSLHSSGQFTEAYSEELEKMALGFSKLSSFSKSEIIDLIARLNAFGATKANIKELTQATLDLGTVLGRDLASASQVVTAALNGNFGPAMRTLRLHFDDGDNASDKLTKTMERMAEISKGQAAESVNTLSGAFEQNKKELVEWSEVMGKTVVQAIVNVGHAMEGLKMMGKDIASSLSSGSGAATASTISELKAQQANLELLIGDQVSKGKLTPAQGAHARSQLGRASALLNDPMYSDPTVGTAGGFYGVSAQGSAMDSMAAQVQAIFAGLASKLGVAIPGYSGGKKDTVPDSEYDEAGTGMSFGDAGGYHASDPVAEAAALKELQKIQAQIRVESLQGEDALFQKIFEHYTEQGILIEKNSHIAQETDAQTDARLEANDKAYLNAVDVAKQKISIADQKRQADLHAQEQTLRDQATALQLKGRDLEIFNEQTDFANREQKLTENFDLSEEEYGKLTALEETLHAVKMNNIAKEHDASQQFNNDLLAVGGVIREQLTTNLAHGLVASFTEGSAALKTWLHDFLNAMAEAILKAELLYALRLAFGGTGVGNFLGLAEGGQVTKAAGGYMGMVSSPTYLPDYKVLTGEAGREMLTVLSQPIIRNYGGLAAQVGNVGNRRMAVVDANGLQAITNGSGGAGGSVNINVSLSPGLQAEITQNSIQGAKVAVAQDLTQDTPISRAAKRLTA